MSANQKKVTIGILVSLIVVLGGVAILLIRNLSVLPEDTSVSELEPTVPAGFRLFDSEDLTVTIPEQWTSIQEAGDEREYLFENPEKTIVYRINVDKNQLDPDFIIDDDNVSIDEYSTFRYRSKKNGNFVYELNGFSLGSFKVFHFESEPIEHIQNEDNQFWMSLEIKL